MNRLTDDKTAEGIKRICDGLIAAGAEPTMSDRRYVRLAEYEQTGWSPTKIKALIDWSNSPRIKELYENERIAEQYKWISVKDRMPEMCRDVIGFCASKEPELFDGVIEIVYLKDTINFLGERKVTPYWCCDDREFFRTNYEVTHWMPLPEPPKEDEVCHRTLEDFLKSGK